MHGNVQEWCLDYFSKYDSNSIPIPDPLIITYNKNGVIRGGGWKSRPEQCRSASRLKTYGTPTIKLNRDDKLYEDTGFRVVCRPPVITEKGND
jgi:formylglycine-generating enzyme required for sulfatase activity